MDNSKNANHKIASRLAFYRRIHCFNHLPLQWTDSSFKSNQSVINFEDKLLKIYQTRKFLQQQQIDHHYNGAIDQWILLISLPKTILLKIIKLSFLLLVLQNKNHWLSGKNLQLLAQIFDKKFMMKFYGQTMITQLLNYQLSWFEFPLEINSYLLLKKLYENKASAIKIRLKFFFKNNLLQNAPIELLTYWQNIDIIKLEDIVTNTILVTHPQLYKLIFEYNFKA